MTQSVFKTAEGRDKIRAYYNNVLGSFPFGQTYVDTAFGKTFVLHAGKNENPPVVLLHGSCSNSAFWFPEILALSQNYRVYAVDIVGEAGNSAEFRPDLQSDAFAHWLKDVLDALGVERAVLIGNSLGGWMALKFATIFPLRVAKLILIASAGLAPIQPSFLSEVSQSRAPDSTLTTKSLVTGEQSMPQAVLDFINLILANYNPIDALPLYSDDQLGQLTMPVLFLGGEHDVIIDAEQSAQRLSKLLPGAELHIIPNCGHAVFDSLDFIIPFLTKGASS